MYTMRRIKQDSHMTMFFLIYSKQKIGGFSLLMNSAKLEIGSLFRDGGSICKSIWMSSNLFGEVLWGWYSRPKIESHFVYIIVFSRSFYTKKNYVYINHSHFTDDFRKKTSL